jgi:hypothetical protein
MRNHVSFGLMLSIVVPAIPDEKISFAEDRQADSQDSCKSPPEWFRLQPMAIPYWLPS